MNLNQWAIKWAVPYEALEDLRREFEGVNTDPTTLKPGQDEGAVQVDVRLEASAKGCRLWRNNRGACYDDKGNFIRYGLANDSDKMDKKIKSHDLIGIRPIVIQQYHVGQIIGQFLSREIKRGGWVYSGTPRELGQLKWGNLVMALGGDAGFANSTGTI